MSRFIEVTRIYYAADDLGLPKKPLEEVEVDTMVNVDRIVWFRPIDGNRCRIKTADEKFDVTQTYDFICNLINPPCGLHPYPRG